VSAGVPNEYGHPHAEAIARWQAVGARVYRTDEQGEISLRSDGDGLSVSGGQARVSKARVNRSGRTVALRTDHPIGREYSNGNRTAPGGIDMHYVASRRSRVFHLADCPGAATIVRGNRIAFVTREEASATGRTPAEDCHP